MNLLGIDFEEWFHPELIQNYVKLDERKARVVDGIDKILDWLRKYDTLATFFVVGEILEARPDLMDKILQNGHEIAFHTMHHMRLNSMTPQKFEDEVVKFSDLTNKKSRGFRAPTFSLDESTKWAVDILAKNNYLYDSSVVPVKTRLYGIDGAESKPYKISSNSISKNDPNGIVWEFPLMTTTFFGKRIPAAGGFYLRFLPLSVIEKALKKYELESKPAVFYIHSWELIPESMPRIHVPFVNKFVTYYNLDKAPLKMSKILRKFRFTSFQKGVLGKLPYD